MYSERRPVRLQLYPIVYAAIAVLLVATHSPILDLPYYWDEIGQFIPASLDLFQHGLWIPRTTLPNVHPPGVMAWLAAFWHVFGYSIPGARIAMLLIAALGATATFLLAIELGRGTPGAPAFTALGLLCVSPLFFAQAMLAQLDMPAMCFTALALLLFLQDRIRASAAVCVVLVLVKETGIAAPALFCCWLLWERRTREAVWFTLPGVVLALWLVVVRRATGHWFGNSEFTQYNVFYPLNPVRLGFALLRRAYYLFAGSGHFIGTAALLWAWRRVPLLRSRAWRIAGAFLAVHCVVVSLLGGAVLERYLLPALPVLYAAFAVSLWSLLPRWRAWALAGLLLCLCCANFVNPLYPFPFENNLAFVSFVGLERRAAIAVEDVPGVLVTTFPMADAFRRREYGYVRRPRKVREIPDFRRGSIDSLRAQPPEAMIVYDTTWDPLHLLRSGPGAWLMGRFYGFEPQMTDREIASALSMRVARHWERGGMSMSLLVVASGNSRSRRAGQKPGGRAEALPHRAAEPQLIRSPEHTDCSGTAALRRRPVANRPDRFPTCPTGEQVSAGESAGGTSARKSLSAAKILGCGNTEQRSIRDLSVPRTGENAYSTDTTGMWCYIESGVEMALVPPYISALQPYKTARSVDEIRQLYGLSRVVKLASNENPLGPSPLAVAALSESLGSLHLYPSGGLRLREVLARQFGTKVENVIAGSGSEGIMSNIVRTFLGDDDEVLTADATFIGIRVLAQSRGVRYRTVPLKNWRFDLPALAEAINERTKIVYLSNPNNPTGTIFTRHEFDEFYRHVPERVLIILDEAYFEYARDNPSYPDSMHYRYDNVITLRTFSKAYGLAGVRIGYGFAHEDLIANLLKVKLPFEPSALAEIAGIAALSDREFLYRTLELNARGMRFVTRELKSAGIEFVPSEGNFVMTLWPDEKAAENFADNLLKSGVIVRPLASFGVARGVRISIGTEEENELLIASLQRAMQRELVCN